ncbi:MAG: HD domain-containing protein [Candidatus Chryseobacterium colombiense]|nr:HD domain-containing protein [Chryseobacterium sp.]WEK71338.1 MAG: HD domain-containing protein [Chryseobacterium sp.]
MNNLLQAVREYVIHFLTERLSAQLTFHNIEHTYEVVSAVLQISEKSVLSVEDRCALQVSAWFHDCGYAFCYKGHEEESKRIAQNFLGNLGCETDFIQKVLRCIGATQYPQNPSSEIEKIICDADMFHLTRTDYAKYEKALRLEFSTYLGLIFTDEEWQMENNDFLKNHQYFTEYGQQVLAKFKEVNVRLMNDSNQF